MELLIKIPKEFEQHFKQDAFEDSLHRLSADAHLIAGLYEQETAAMLIESLKNAVHIPAHGRCIDADVLRYWSDDSAMIAFDYVTRSQINAAPTIIPASEEDEA